MNSMGPISVIGTQGVGHANSVGPIRSFEWDQNVTKRKQGVCIANSVGRIAHFDETETLRRETESLQPHLDENEIPISETKLIRVSGSGYVK